MLDFTFTRDMDEIGTLAGVQFIGNKPVYVWQGAPVVVHDVFKSSGVSYANVTAAEPIFTTEGRYPGRPTPHGLVLVDELVPLVIEGSPLEEALENWIGALNDAEAFEDNELRADYFAAEQMVIECGQQVAEMLLHY